MYVCLCEGISDRTVRRAIRRGACTIEEIGAACGAGTGCGGCWDTLEELLDHPEHRSARHPAEAAAHAAA